jgi:hypothetical protein
VCGDTARNAFPIRVEHVRRANMAVEADMSLKMRCKCFGNFCQCLRDIRDLVDLERFSDLHRSYVPTIHSCSFRGRRFTGPISAQPAHFPTSGHQEIRAEVRAS